MAQWVGIVDDTNEKDHGVQGFLQLSVVVLGPGDKQRTHGLIDVAEAGEHDVEAVKGKGDKDALTLQQLVLIPPSVKQDLHFLVVTIHRVCESNGGGRNGNVVYVFARGFCFVVDGHKDTRQ